MSVIFTGPNIPQCQIKPGTVYHSAEHVDKALVNFPGLKRFVIPLDVFTKMKRRTIMRPLGLNKLR